MASNSYSRGYRSRSFSWYLRHIDAKDWYLWAPLLIVLIVVIDRICRH